MLFSPVGKLGEVLSPEGNAGAVGLARPAGKAGAAAGCVANPVGKLGADKPEGKAGEFSGAASPVGKLGADKPVGKAGVLEGCVSSPAGKLGDATPVGKAGAVVAGASKPAGKGGGAARLIPVVEISTVVRGSKDRRMMVEWL